MTHSCSHNFFFYRLLFYLLLPVLSFAAKSQCIRLQNSQVCPSFSSSEVSFQSDNLTLFDSNLPRNVMYLLPNCDAWTQLFTQAIQNNTGLSSLTSSFPPSLPSLRFQNTIMCALTINQSDPECRVSVPPVCQSTCIDFLTDLSKVASKICTSDADKASLERSMLYWRNNCHSSPLFSANSNCIDGLMNEGEMCGFKEEKPACEFCGDNKSQGCCQDLSCASLTSSGGNNDANNNGTMPSATTTFSNPSASTSGSNLSVAALVGIILGGLVFSLGIVLIAVIMRRRRKRRIQRANMFARVSTEIKFHPRHSSLPPNQASRPSTIGVEEKVQSWQSYSYSEDSLPERKRETILENLSEVSVISEKRESLGESKSGTTHPSSRDSGSSISIQTSSGMGSATVFPVPFQYRAFAKFEPELSDEVYLAIGDVVAVSCIFDDGWAVGRNMRTGEEGAFPLACATRIS